MKWNWKKFFGYLAFFVAVVLAFWYFTFRGTNNWKASLKKLTTVQPFHFTDQDGHDFTNQDVQGKVYVTNYFFTTCHGICPRMNSNMKAIYEEFKNDPDFMIVSHTCMPEVDSVAVLKHYADSMHVDTKKWVFVTGRKDSLYNAARNSYLLDDNKNVVQNISDQFIHTQFFALVDKDGNVRGEIFDGLKKADLDRLREDIKILLEEKQGGRSHFTNNIFGNNM